MPTVSTSELVDRAKAAADMRDNFVTPTQWMYWASQERLALDFFLARSGWPQLFTTFDIEVDGSEQGVYGIGVTTGVMAIVCVHQKTTNGAGDQFRLLRHQNVVDFNPNTKEVGSAQEYRVVWSGNDLALHLYPRPTAGEVYRVTYLPHPATLVLSSPGSNQATSVAYPLGWEERIVLGMARRALIKEESDTRAVDQEIAVWDQRIEEACWSRVLSDAPAVRNIDARTYGWSDRHSIPPFGAWTWV